jgi:hypothetical protein
VWWDRKIIPGENFDQVIEHELEAAKSIVVLWSKNSISSEWVKNEAAMAAERGVLVPAMIDSVKLPLEFRRRQAADMIGWDGNLSHGGFKALCHSIVATANVKDVPLRHHIIAPWDGFRWNRYWTLAAIMAITIALGFASYWGLLVAQQSEALISTKPIAGIWYADIQYSWGVSEIERFDFTIDGEQLVGTASFAHAESSMVDCQRIGCISSRSLTTGSSSTGERSGSRRYSSVSTTRASRRQNSSPPEPWKKPSGFGHDYPRAAPSQA